MLILDTMAFILFVFVISALPKGIISLAFSQRTFHLDARYNNKLPTTGIVEGLSNIDCALCAYVCLSTENCESFFHKEMKCVPFLNRMRGRVPTVQSIGMVYYEIKGRFGNLALQKITTQTSTMSGWTSSLAVDNSRINWIQPPDSSCSHTHYSPDENAYALMWQVDLGSVFEITTVALLARNVDGDRMENLIIKVGMTTSMTDPAICAVNPSGKPFRDEWRTFRCPQPIKGQFVRIERKGNYLILCEVEIYA